MGYVNGVGLGCQVEKCLPRQIVLVWITAFLKEKVNKSMIVPAQNGIHKRSNQCVVLGITVAFLAKVNNRLKIVAKDRYVQRKLAAVINLFRTDAKDLFEGSKGFYVTVIGGCM